MTARWIPGDGELDEVARELEAAEPTRERAEQNRTALLAAAAGRAQIARRSRVPVAVGAIALAAAAAAAIWVGVRPHDRGVPVLAAPKEVITPIGVARFERVNDWADFVVRLDDGKLAVAVAGLEAADRFRIKTADAEVETRGARFDVGADQGRIASVDVHEGRVELRRIDQQVVILSAGQSWGPVKTAEREDVPLQPAQPAPAAPEHRSVKHDAPKHEPAKHAAAEPRELAPPARVGTVAPAREPTPAAPNPGEAEFRAGMASLRAGDADAAAHAFATACTLAKHEALGDDACFWSGAAAKRSGDTATARTALAAFLRDFPSSPRAAEAAALLGWIDYDAGDLDAAEGLFRQAQADRVPQVRDSAQRGLTAIDRKRHSAP